MVARMRARGWSLEASQASTSSLRSARPAFGADIALCGVAGCVSGFSGTSGGLSATAMNLLSESGRQTEPQSHVSGVRVVADVVEVAKGEDCIFLKLPMEPEIVLQAGAIQFLVELLG